MNNVRHAETFVPQPLLGAEAEATVTSAEAAGVSVRMVRVVAFDEGV